MVPNLLLAVAIAVGTATTAVRTAEPEPPPATGKAYSKHTILQTLYDDVLSTLSARHAHVASLKTRADWQARRADVRAALTGGLFASIPGFSHRTVRVEYTSEKLVH